MWRLDDEDSLWDGDAYDLHCVQSPPVEDAEAELIEMICQAATPGPLVLDDASDGEGALVATLPDGRNIVSLTAVQPCLEDAHSRAAADAQLICEARGLILRLLRDRQRWKRQEDRLREKIQALEDRLERKYEAVEQARRPPKTRAAVHPR
ncbi:MAG: hypothetical protein ABIP48_28130 [Planctomycetota bacterium]